MSCSTNPNLLCVDFIKMDIEGGKIAALRGMKRTIEANPNVTICVGMSPWLSDAGELLDILNHGFEISDTKDPAVVEKMR